METLIQKRNQSHIIALLLIGSVGMSASNFWTPSPNTYFLSSFLGSALLALLVGWIGLLVFSATIHYSSKFFGGKGTFKTSVDAVAWSLTPAIVNLVLFVVVWACFGEAFFTDKLDGIPQGIVKSTLFVVRIILSFGATFILVRGVKTGYQLTWYKSVAALILPSIFFALLGLVLIGFFAL